MNKVLLFTGVIVISLHSFGQTAYPDSTFTEYFRRTQGWTAGDATISIPLPEEQTMWLFGDSYIDHYQSSDNTVPCLFQVRNSFMVQDNLNPDNMATHIDLSKTGINQTYFKINKVGNSVFWPGHGFVKNDTVFVFLEKYNSGTYAFLGNYIAKVLLPSYNLISITPLPNMNGINFGKAVLFDSASNYYYIYGNKLNWIVQEPYVARATFKNLVSGNWKFWNGTAWSSNPVQAKKISNKPVSPGFSVIKLQGVYYLITQENGYLTCGLGRNIYSYSSPTPTGKFAGEKLLYTVEDQVNGNYLLTYNAQAHPEFFENNELLISYNVNDGVDTVLPYVCPSECVDPFNDRMNADSYRPKFIRVPMNALQLKTTGVMLNSVTISPNPVITQLVAHVSGQGERSFSIAVYNSLGQIMMEEETLLYGSEEDVLLNVSSLPHGVYLLKLKSSNSEESYETKKFVK